MNEEEKEMIRKMINGYIQESPNPIFLEWMVLISELGELSCRPFIESVEKMKKDPNMAFFVRRYVEICVTSIILQCNDDINEGLHMIESIRGALERADQAFVRDGELHGKINKE